MKRSALFIVAGDPLSSHRPAEAVRIAAGVQAWQKITIRLYLHHPIVLALTDQGMTLREETLFRKCLPGLATRAHPVYIPADLPLQMKGRAKPRALTSASPLENRSAHRPSPAKSEMQSPSAGPGDTPRAIGEPWPLYLNQDAEPVYCQEITEPELAALAAHSTWVLYF